MVGTVVSSTIMDWEQVLLLPHASVAVQVLVIEYSCGHPPATVASLKVTTGAVSQLSVAVARPVLPGAVLSSHSIVVLAGQEVITGAVVSSTTTV